MDRLKRRNNLLDTWLSRFKPRKLNRFQSLCLFVKEACVHLLLSKGYIRGVITEYDPKTFCPLSVEVIRYD